MSASSILLVVIALSLPCILVAAFLILLSEIDSRNDRLASERMSAMRRKLVNELSRMSSKHYP